MISSKDLGKGQVSAPFEILVAVIVMGFVILAGTYALKNLSENTCLGDKRKEMGDLVSSLRDVVLGSDLTFRNITFQTKACFNSKAESIQLNAYNEQSRCTAYCGSGVSCVLLEYVYNDEAKQQRKYPIPPICTGLPTTINFSTTESECGLGPDDPNWVLINPIANINGIEPGRYRLFRADTTSGSTSAGFCFLKSK